MRLDDINEVLQHVAMSIQELTEQEKEASTNKSTERLPAVLVKNTLENLRSCLEYCANDIYDALDKESIAQNKPYNKPKANAIYFPYKALEQEFIGTYKYINQLLPDVYLLLLSIQSFTTQKRWLPNLTKSTNDIKHYDLTKQVRKNTALKLQWGNEIRIEGNVEEGEMRGVRVGGMLQVEDLIIKDNEVISRPLDPLLIIEETTEFKFKESDVFILKLLRDSHSEITSLINNLYSLLTPILK